MAGLHEIREERLKKLAILKEKVMSIVTNSARPEDAKNPDENNIYNIHKLFLNKNEDAILRDRFQNGGYNYKDAKEAYAEAVIKFISPFHENMKVIKMI
jgi:tryptophanyl-tRNA synthetase